MNREQKDFRKLNSLLTVFLKGAIEYLESHDLKEKKSKSRCMQVSAWECVFTLATFFRGLSEPFRSRAKQCLDICSGVNKPRMGNKGFHIAAESLIAMAMEIDLILEDHPEFKAGLKKKELITGGMLNAFSQHIAFFKRLMTN